MQTERYFYVIVVFMDILIANDHGGVELKERIVRALTEKGHKLLNLGVDTDASVDYPDIAENACKTFLEGSYDFGILICGSGVGISMAANKIRGIRCAQVFDLFTAEMCKRHNNANFIAFGGRIEYQDDPVKMIETYIAASFEGGRHSRRVEKLDNLVKN